MGRVARWVVVGALLVYAAVCLVVYLGQDRLLYFPVPTRAARDVPVIALERPGARVLVSMREAVGPRAVVYFGGNAEDVSRSVDFLAGAWPGSSVYAMHYRGFGGSTGTPRERDLVGDGIALLERVRARHPDVTLVGRSLGTGVALQAAARVPVSRTVLVTPYASIAGIGRARYPWLPVDLLLRDRYDSTRVAPRINAPVTVIAAGDDAVVPPWSTRALMPHFRAGIATLVVIPHRGHVDVSDDPAYLPALRAAR